MTDPLNPGLPSPRPAHPVVPARHADLDARIAGTDGLLDRLTSLEEHGIRRTFHGFYYISHYYPLRAMTPVTAAEVERTVSTLRGSSFETYIHFPYCEYLCTFCHFYKKPTGSGSLLDREDAALRRVEAEMALYHRILGAPLDARSLQIGGGTPSLISNQRLVTLLGNVREHLSLRSDAEVKIEIYPQDYDERQLREKLRILRDFGFTDLVIDLESGNKQTLDYIVRPRSSLDAYLRLIDICIEEGHTSFITALMAGLPHETYESLDRTLQTLMAIDEVKVVNVFPVIMRETDAISAQFRREPEVFHDARERDRMWLFARNTLRERGYVEGPISYLHHPSVRPAQQSDKFECVNLLGFGASGFGYLNGDDWAAQYFNFCNEKDYQRRIDAGEPAIWRMGVYDQAERARRKVIFGLANVKTEDLLEIEARFGVDLDEIYGKTFNALLDLDLIEVDRAGRGVRYTEAGLARLEELTYFLQSPFARDRCDELPAADDPHRKELINQHYAVTMPPEDRARFEAFVDSRPAAFMHRLR
ncbi:radical SAM protein [Streptomyces sp. NPDC048106]|uniref:radical SAM protein n=1 Tax=Streptomyces sp. NPDC048106 TaxID=3155750 RepID=UPI00345688C8